jgi:eukaryotic-like serine/threonine-protein kinase
MTPVQIGDVLAGKYRVDKILGVGGMGMVVAATHVELDQRVALKFMLPHAAASQQASERFLREARAVVRLRGEHVCRVLDVGRLDAGAPYIVMELLEGEDLSQLLERRAALPAGEAVDLLLQAMEGIAEAHVNGIVHRDLKPGNLFVTSDSDGSPLVKVLDFGISKSSVAGAATRTGEMMGSPAYMAPEQMTSCKTVDARADVWALGVILYQVLTGALPFAGDTLPALCMSVIHEPAQPPLALRADVPAQVSAIVMRCLEKLPSARFADVGELASALAPFGSTDAATTARRVAKVLRRSAVTPVAAPITAPHAVGVVSTLQGSAAQLTPPPAPAPAPRRSSLRAGTLAIAGSIAGIAGLVLVLALRSGGTEAAPIAPAAAVPAPPPAAPVAVAAPEPAPAPRPPAPPPAERPPAEQPPAQPAPRVKSRKLATTQPAKRPATVTEAPKPADPAAPANKWTHMQHDKAP